MTTTAAICVWLDKTSDPSSPAWIISRDEIELPRGNALTTRTLETLDADDSDESDAIEAARKIATAEGLPLYRNSENGPAEEIKE